MQASRLIFTDHFRVRCQWGQCSCPIPSVVSCVSMSLESFCRLVDHISSYLDPPDEKVFYVFSIPMQGQPLQVFLFQLTGFGHSRVCMIHFLVASSSETRLAPFRRPRTARRRSLTSTPAGEETRQRPRPRRGKPWVHGVPAPCCSLFMTFASN